MNENNLIAVAIMSVFLLPKVIKVLVERKREIKEKECKLAFNKAYKEREKNKNIAYAKEIKEHLEKEQRNDLIQWLDNVELVRGGINDFNR